jgi:ankyrin repeat protein
LVSLGADVNASGKYGVTILMWPIKYKQLQSVEFLLDAGADVNKNAGTDGSPAYVAIINNQPQILELLLKRGADPNWEAGNGETLLKKMILRRDLKTFRLLVKFGADISKPGKRGLTPAAYATKIHAYQFASELLNLGADPLDLGDSEAIGYPQDVFSGLINDPGDLFDKSSPYWRSKVIQTLRDKGFDIENEIAIREEQWREYRRKRDPTDGLKWLIEQTRNNRQFEE